MNGQDNHGSAPFAQEFTFRGTGRQKLMKWAGIGLSVLALPMLVASELLFGQFTKHPYGWLLIILPIAAVAFLFLGPFLLIWAWRRSRRSISVCETGFTVRLGKHEDFVDWNDVLFLQQGTTTHTVNFIIPAGTTHNYSLGLRDGDELEFDDGWPRVTDFAQAVEEATLPRLMPKAAEIYGRGQVVPFGAVGLSRGGIHTRQALLPWDQLADATYDRDYLSLTKVGMRRRWAHVPRNDIPNFHIFWEMVSHVRAKIAVQTSAKR